MAHREMEICVTWYFKTTFLVRFLTFPFIIINGICMVKTLIINIKVKTHIVSKKKKLLILTTNKRCTFYAILKTAALLNNVVSNSVLCIGMSHKSPTALQSA